LYFLKALESVLISLYSNTVEFIISEGININYLNDNGKRKRTPCYLLLVTVVQYNPHQEFIITTSAIDNTFIDKVIYDKYAICLFINGLSDHNTKIITIHNIPQNQISCTQTRRKFNKFMINLIYES